jgi:SulP family sulfate permease
VPHTLWPRISLTQEPSALELFTPKLITVLRENYRLRDFRADLVAGLTVAVVALPLSMAIAIASGVTPDRGLYTSIFGGFVVSLLSGSRFQIGGPAGAFIVLVAATAATHGVDGLILAAFLSGIMLFAVGALRLGTFVKYIPYPVTVAFTGGIAVIILASQVKDLLGLTLAGNEPGPFIPKVEALAAALPSFNLSAGSVALLSILVILAVRRFRPQWPSYLIAVVLGSLLVWAFNLPAETLGSRFGGIPRSLPLPHLPMLSADKIIEVLPSAVSFALLGSIESLLSAVVADSMTGRRHRSNCELVAQGTANMVSALFGGICVTGTIARTATNVRAGARSPISGMAHSVFLMMFMLLAAPLASYVPLAALAGVLAVVAWNMAEKHAFMTLIRASRGDAAVLLITFALVVFRDLTEGILVGFTLSALLFLHRMATAVEVEGRRAPAAPAVGQDVPDTVPSQPRSAYDASIATNPDIVVYRISGAFFFGTAAAVGAALDRIGAQPKHYVIEMSSVPVLDSTAAATLEGFVRRALAGGMSVHITGAHPAVQRTLSAHGIRPPGVQFVATVADAFAAIAPIRPSPA